MSLLASTISLLGQALPATRANRLLILIYHRVHPTPDPMFPGEVDAERFDWQMALLRRYCNPLSLSEGVAGLKRGKLSPRAVAITFDDGYADNATVALPILQKHGLTATFFIATGFLDGGRMWNDSIIESVRRALVGDLDTGEIGLGSVGIGSEAERGLAAERIIKAVKHQPPNERRKLVEMFCGKVSASLPDDLMLTTQQVRSMSAAGMEIGAHTVSHPILLGLTNEEAREEILRSREALERMVEKPVKAFAYPNGRPGEDYGPRDRALVESLGMGFALCTRRGVGHVGSDPFQLPRFTPWNSASTTWLARLLAIFQAAA